MTRVAFMKLVVVGCLAATVVACGNDQSTRLATSAALGGPPPGVTDPEPKPAPPLPLGQRKVSKEQAVARVTAIQPSGSARSYEARDVQLGDLFADREHDAEKASTVRRVPQQPAIAVLVRGRITPSYDVTGKIQLAWAVYAVDGDSGEILATWGSPDAADATWFEKLVERA